MRPVYNLDKIKFATDGPTFEKAFGLPIKIRFLKDAPVCQN